MFGFKLKNQFILLFSLFLLLFMSFTILFNTIYKFYCTILINFYFYYEILNKKISISTNYTDSNAP